MSEMKEIAKHDLHTFLVENIPCGILLMDFESRLFEANSAFENITGFKKEILLENKLVDLILPKQRAQFVALLRVDLNSSKTWHSEFNILRADQRIVTIDLIANVVNINHEIFILAIINEITERNKIQRKQLLDEKLTATSFLAAGLAHELNNPAAYIYMNLNFINDKLTKITEQFSEPAVILEKLSEINHIVKQSLTGIERIRDVIKNLKGFTHITENDSKEFNIHEILDASVSVVSANIYASTAKLIKDYQASNFMTYGSSGKLQQMFTHLLMNAAQSIDPANSEDNTITIHTFNKNNGIEIAIKDTGVGISDDLLGKIFDPFFSTKTAAGHKGLGLFICYDIVRGEGGEITVYNLESHGTCINIFLPLRKKPVTVANVVKNIELKTGKLKILLIDDEQDILNALARGLNNDFEVTTLQNPAEALALLTKTNGNFDIIVSDLIMPQMRGMELFQQVKQSFPGLENNMIFMTGGIYSPEVYKFLESIQNHSLDKPFKVSDLVKIINAQKKKLF